MTATRTRPAVAKLPELQGHPATFGGYRLYTVDALAFDALPAYGDGGPAMATAGGWCVSYCHGNDGGPWTLHIYRSHAGTAPSERHPLHGTTYPDRRDATRAAYEAGALAFMVYERAAARFGLPTGQPADHTRHAQEDTMPENPARRVIITEGDGRPVYRTARKFEATAAVHLAPVDTAHSSRDFPGVRLVVEPSGAWRVEVMPQGDREPEAVTVAASGNLAELIPANRAAQYEATKSRTGGDPVDLGGDESTPDVLDSDGTYTEDDRGIWHKTSSDAPAYVWTDHTNDIGDGCPHSGDPIGADVDPDDDAAACPARCRRSGVEEAGA